MEEVITHWGALSTTQVYTTTSWSVVNYYVYLPNIHFYYLYIYHPDLHSIAHCT